MGRMYLLRMLFCFCIHRRECSTSQQEVQGLKLLSNSQIRPPESSWEHLPFGLPSPWIWSCKVFLDTSISHCSAPCQVGSAEGDKEKADQPQVSFVGGQKQAARFLFKIPGKVWVKGEMVGWMCVPDFWSPLPVLWAESPAGIELE